MSRSVVLPYALLLLFEALPVGAEAREVMSWVPPYAINGCRATLQSEFGGISPADGLTRIGLQFWVPAPDGTVILTQDYGVREAGFAPEVISMGLPGWEAGWGFGGGRGTNVLSHLQECIYDCTVPASVCIWDLQLTGTAGPTNWQSAVVWEMLSELAAYESVPADKDGDGMADPWEISYLGGTNATLGLAGDDRDGDGTPNLHEYVSGTDPTNHASVFRLDLATGGSGELVISYPARPVARFDPCYGDAKRVYRLEENTNLLHAAWGPVAGGTNTPDVAGMHDRTSAVPWQAGLHRAAVQLRR